MKKAIITCLIALCSLPAVAEWVLVSETDTSAYYFDPTTIRVDGNLRKVWTIRNLNQRDKDGEMSTQSRREFDCKDERNRVLSLSTHSEPMANGKLILNLGADPNGWQETPPGGIGALILKMVCAK